MGGVNDTGLYVHGPCEIYVANSVSGVLQYLGESPESIQPVIETMLQPVMLDKGGTIVPVDHQFMGKGIVIATTLGRMNRTVLEDFNKTIKGAGGSGEFNAGDIGALLLAGGHSRRVFLKSTYYNPAVQPDLPAGINIPCCVLERVGTPRGVSRSIAPIVIRGVQVVNLCTGTATVYNNDNAGVPTSSCV